MITLLGETVILGSVAAQLERRRRTFQNLSRSTMDYTRFDRLLAWLKEHRPEFVINCAGYTGKPNVDACEAAWADTLQGNAILPLTVASACAALNNPWGQVSSGCIYSGAKVMGPWTTQVSSNLAYWDSRQI